MILTKHGDDGLKYAAGRKWNTASDKIDLILPNNINERHLPGFGQQVKYPFLTVSDFFEDKIIEVSYEINRAKFFTGCNKEITFLLPLKKVFFEYFSINDLVDENGNYTNMLVVEYDDERAALTIQLRLPLINGHEICLHKKYDTSEQSKEKVDCYDGSKTFDFSVFPFYRLEPDTSHNIYNIMIGSTIDGVTAKFYEQDVNQSIKSVDTISKHRTNKGTNSQLATEHLRVNGAFTFMELSIACNGEDVKALVLPIFRKVNSDPTLATDEFTFSIDFGTTNTHVSYVKTKFIVFWSKNPKPLLKYIDLLKEKRIGCYIQYTLNDYVAEGLERGVPSVDERIETFKQLVDKLGKGSVIWRFDPMILTDKISVDDLLRKVEYIGDRLLGYTEKLVFSFADITEYRKVKSNLEKNGINYHVWTEEEMLIFAERLSELNKKWGYELATCGEKIDIEQFGIKHNHCVDDDLMIRLAHEDRDLMKFLEVEIKQRGTSLFDEEIRYCQFS